MVLTCLDLQLFASLCNSTNSFKIYRIRWCGKQNAEMQNKGKQRLQQLPEGDNVRTSIL